MRSIEEINIQTFIDRVLVWTDNYLRMNELRLLVSGFSTYRVKEIETT
jgi:hypothetical protein